MHNDHDFLPENPKGLLFSSAAIMINREKERFRERKSDAERGRTREREGWGERGGGRRGGGGCNKILPQSKNRKKTMIFRVIVLQMANKL